MVYVHIENNGSLCAVEGSYAYSCLSGLVPKTTYCMRDGSWDPNPNELECHLMAGTTSPTLGMICYKMCGAIIMYVCYTINHYPFAYEYRITDTKSDVLIPSLIVSLLVFGIVTFLFGLLFGILLINYIPKSPKQNESDVEPAHGSVPLYEEIRLPSIPMDQNFIKIKDNEAYSHI